MEKNELRIGNWYQSVKFNVPVRCELSDLYELCAKSDGAYNDPPIEEMFKPIPLTEEWLLKFGFKQFGDNSCKIKTLHGNIYVDYFRNVCYPGNNFSIHKFKYVHQLQNLYLALTGNELEIKEK